MPLYHITLCKICHQYFCVSPNVNINPIQTFWAMIKLWMPESGPPWWMKLVFISPCQARVCTERKQEGSERSPNAQESCIWWTPKPLDKNYWDLCFWCELCLSLRLDSFQVNIRRKENCELLTAGFCLWSSIRNQKHPGPDGAGRISWSGIKWQLNGRRYKIIFWSAPSSAHPGQEAMLIHQRCGLLWPMDIVIHNNVTILVRPVITQFSLTGNSLTPFKRQTWVCPKPLHWFSKVKASLDLSHKNEEAHVRSRAPENHLIKMSQQGDLNLGCHPNVIRSNPNGLCLHLISGWDSPELVCPPWHWSEGSGPPDKA